jgi:hypothetical protein
MTNSASTRPIWRKSVRSSRPASPRKSSVTEANRWAGVIAGAGRLTIAAVIVG